MRAVGPIQVITLRLPAAGIGYLWERLLGGFRRPAPDSANTALRHPSFRGFADYMRTGEFRAGLDEVAAAAAGPRRRSCAQRPFGGAAIAG